MAKFFRNPFATSGDKTAIPDDTQPSGVVSYENGYSINYQLDQDTDPNALDVEREGQNQIFFDITDNLQDWQTFGTYDFITAAQNNGSDYPYNLNAKAAWTDNSVFTSRTNSNTDDPDDTNGNWLYSSPAAPAVNWMRGEVIGSPLSRPGSNEPSMCALTETDVVLVLDTNPPTLAVYRFDGASYSQVGSDFSATGHGANPAVCAISSTDIALVSSSQDLSRYSFNGTTWAKVGSDFSLPSPISDPSMTALSNTDVVLTEQDISSTLGTRVYRNNGTSWSEIASTTFSYEAITAISPTRFVSFFNTNLRMHEVDGSDINIIGSAFNIGPLLVRPHLCTISAETVILAGENSNVITPYRFEATTFKKVGVSTAYTHDSTCMASMSGGEISIYDTASDNLSFYRFTSTYGVLPRSREITG